MSKRHFPDRLPGTMAHQHRVGGEQRPKAAKITVRHPDGSTEVVSQRAFNERKAAIRAARICIAGFLRLVREELDANPSANKAAVEALVWSRLEREYDQSVWNEARRLYEEGGAVEASHAPVEEVVVDSEVVVKARVMLSVPEDWVKPGQLYAAERDEHGVITFTPRER